jgi:transcriptional regulator with XRE-family HTH domain
MPKDTADLALMYGLESEDDSQEVAALAVAYGLIDELARRRASSGLTQSQVAARMGTSQAAIAKLETHRHDPRLSTLARYIAAIRLPAEDLAALLVDLGTDVEPEIEEVRPEVPAWTEWEEFVKLASNALTSSHVGEAWCHVVGTEVAVPSARSSIVDEHHNSFSVADAKIVHLYPDRAEPFAQAWGSTHVAMGQLFGGSQWPVIAAEAGNVDATATAGPRGPAFDRVYVKGGAKLAFRGALSHVVRVADVGVKADGMIILGVLGNDNLAILARAVPTSEDTD